MVGAAEYFYDPNGVSDVHAFLYQDRSMRDLGSLGGTYAEARALNNAGSVVCYSLLADAFVQHAFLYENGRMRDLHRATRMPAGWVLVTASDINDRRQILGQACLNEDCITVRLDPLRPAATSDTR